ncbi:MAG: FHA domain-containing protein [Caldisericia bacterium]|jgi:hypothetical protein|nr:FHA domain-containing protein [Caldisericia bacterium]
MFKKFSLILVLILLALGLFSCKAYPENPSIVKTADINNNPLNYDQHFIAVKGRVVANGTQPSLQLGWYDLADETGTIAILTTPDVPKVGQELWVSGTVIYATKVVGARTLSIVIQEKERRVIGGINTTFIIIIAVIVLVALTLLYLFVFQQRVKPTYIPIKKETPRREQVRYEEPIKQSTIISEPPVSKKASETIIDEGATEPVLAYLIVKSGRRVGASYPLRKKVINIGRESDNDIVLDDPKVSRQHAKMKIEGDTFVIYDLASSNGTFVNNQKITNELLHDGDEIKIGDTIFVFKKI